MKKLSTLTDHPTGDVSQKSEPEEKFVSEKVKESTPHAWVGDTILGGGEPERLA